MDNETISKIIFNEALCFAKSKHKTKKECTLNDIQRFINKLHENDIYDKDNVIEMLMKGKSDDNNT